VNGRVRSMRIGVIGAGWLDGTVGRQWVKTGHQVLFLSRHPERLKNLAQDLGSRASAGSVVEAASFGQVVLIATPHEALAAIGRDHHEALRGKIVLDATNPWPSERFARDAERDGVGPTSARLLAGTRVVRTFSAVDATAVEASAKGHGERLAVPLAGDDKEGGRQGGPTRARRGMRAFCGRRPRSGSELRTSWTGLPRQHEPGEIAPPARARGRRLMPRNVRLSS
jgi:8-hydroxy-5-deazaflavin:NADPH oxidoreductase